MLDKNIKASLKEYIKPALIIITYLIMMYLLADSITKIIAAIVANKMNLTKDYINEFAASNLGISEYPTDILKYMYSTSAIVNLAIYLILFIICGSLSIKYIKEDLINMQNKSNIFGVWIPLGLILAYGIEIFLSLITTMFADNPVSENQEAINAIFETGGSNAIMMAISAVILGPVVEEIVFRKGIFKLIKNNFIALIISSILFGLIHTIDSGYNIKNLILHTIPYMGYGIGIGIAYIKTEKNILTTIIIHITINTVAMLLMTFMQSYM